MAHNFVLVSMRMKLWVDNTLSHGLEGKVNMDYYYFLVSILTDRCMFGKVYYLNVPDEFKLYNKKG